MKKSTSKINRVKFLDGVPLAVVSVIDEVVLLSRSKKNSSDLFLSWSSNGVDFVKDIKKVTIKTISKKAEKIKELISYDEYTLSEIAYYMGYSSVQYLSNQFKQVTGFSTSEFKKLKGHRKSIDEL